MVFVDFPARQEGKYLNHRDPGLETPCPHLNECIIKANVFTCGEKRYKVNAVITTKVTEHQSILVDSCPCTGENLSGKFPEGIRAYVQYGDSVSVLVGLLSTYGAVSAMRIHVLLGSLLGVSLSTGTITSMVSKCAKKVGGSQRKHHSMTIIQGDSKTQWSIWVDENPWMTGQIQMICIILFIVISAIANPNSTKAQCSH